MEPEGGSPAAAVEHGPGPAEPEEIPPLSFPDPKKAHNVSWWARGTGVFLAHQ